MLEIGLIISISLIPELPSHSWCKLPGKEGRTCKSVLICFESSLGDNSFQNNQPSSLNPPVLDLEKARGNFSKGTSKQFSCGSLENLIFERFRAFELENFLPSAVIFEPSPCLIWRKQRGNFFKGGIFQGTRLMHVVVGSKVIPDIRKISKFL